MEGIDCNLQSVSSQSEAQVTAWADDWWLKSGWGAGAVWQD